jgi:hypothetical protein
MGIRHETRWPNRRAVILLLECQFARARGVGQNQPVSDVCGAVVEGFISGTVNEVEKLGIPLSSPANSCASLTSRARSGIDLTYYHGTRAGQVAGGPAFVMSSQLIAISIGF